MLCTAILEIGVLVSLDGSRFDGCPRDQCLAWELVVKYRQKSETDDTEVVVGSLSCRCQRKNQTNCLKQTSPTQKGEYGNFADLSGVVSERLLLRVCSFSPTQSRIKHRHKLSHISQTVAGHVLSAIAERVLLLSTPATKNQETTPTLPS